MSLASALVSGRPPAPTARPYAGLLHRVGIALLAGGFVAYAGMFGTGDVPMGVRLAYWCGLLAAGTFSARLLLGVLRRQRWLAGRPWLTALALTAGLALAGLLPVWAAGAAAFGHGFLLADLERLVGPVLALSAVMVALNRLADRGGTATVPPAPASVTEPPKFLQRLPARLSGAQILAIEAEDHFLRIHTDQGSHLILMRLSDAVAELDGLPGGRVHRSWWVARAAVMEVARGRGRAVFTLKSGLKAPVSRTYAAALRRDGWY